MPSYDGNNKVNVSDFFSAVQSYGLSLTQDEAVLLCKFYDKDNTEMMNFEDFLFSITGKPNEERQAVIDLVYYKFDKSRIGYAEASELRKVFNCVKHPRFLMNEYTEDQIFYLYLKNFSNEVNGAVTKKVS